jgi:uncharacterized protein (TIGR03118 family)
MMMRSAGPAAGRPAQRSKTSGRRLWQAGFLAVGSSAALAVLPATSGLAATTGAAKPASAKAATPYAQTNLVSDIPGVARITDPNLVNPWGVSELPNGPLWVSDNGTNVSTLYTGALNGSPLTPVPLVVKIPGGAPTGQVFNGTKGFVVRHGKQSGAALFIFASENGVIAGWNPTVGAVGTATSTKAQVGVKVPNAVFKGLATMGGRLYATNFHSGQVDVFNSHFRRVFTAGGFRDPRIPHGFAPFNITSIGGNLYVSYAKQDAQRHDDVAGAGHGFIDVYSPKGMLLHRLVRRGALNSPWGMVIAPSSFGTFSNDLLVANFGDGALNAFDPATGAFLGPLKNGDGNPIVISGLWGLILGDGAAGTPQTVFFTAGLAAESHGLLGTITPGS